MNEGKRLEIVLYTRAGCCLCHDAELLLRERQSRDGFELCIVDIDADAALRERYDTCVPVITFDGKERFRGLVTAALLDRQLRAESRLRG